MDNFHEKLIIIHGNKFVYPFRGNPHNFVQQGTSDSKFILYYNEYPYIKITK
jgi:hypothetical protein